MSKFSVVFVSFLLIISFQNCGKPQVPQQSESSSQSSELSYNKFALDSFKVLSVWDFMNLQYLDINLANGSIQVFEEAGQGVGATYQLKQIEIDKLNSILSQAEICEPIVTLPDPQQVCSLMYRYPYAILVNLGDEVRLGEMTNGCDVPVDLCGAKAQQLKAWSSKLVEKLNSGEMTE